MRSILSIVVLLFSFLFVQAQNEAKVALPTIIPASPEVSQLTKVGSLSAGLHTGSANVSIPLYSLSVDKLKLDIALSYSSNGIREDEIPSVVGLGWNLVAGGVVSRVVHDDPDGTLPYLAPPANPFLHDQAMLDYLLQATKFGDTKDTEYDEYSYSFNGMSGKFFLNPTTGDGYCIPHNTLKVKVLNHNGVGTKSVKITTPDGIIFHFGISSKELSKEISISGGGTGLINKTGDFETAWFLDKIETPEGSVVNFAYSQHTVQTAQGRFETVIKPTMPTRPYSCDYNCDKAYSIQSGINLINYITHRLTSITTDNGLTVNFGYEGRPDGSNDIRLKTLTISSAILNEVGMIKRYAMDYHDPVNANSMNVKYYLTALRETDLTTLGESGPEKSLAHQFEYFSMGGSRLSKGQDYFGYPNGKASVFFAPYVPSIANGVMNGSDGADRTPGSLVVRMDGILTRVKYPTGGYEEFTYEEHQVPQFSSSTAFQSESIGGSGLNASDPQTYLSNIFIPTSDQTAQLTLKSFKNPAFPDNPSGEVSIIYDFKLVNVSTNEILLRKKFTIYTEETIARFVQANTQYRIELTVWGQVNSGTALIQYNPQTNATFINKDACGLRVKQIKSFDPVTGKANNRYYKYHSFSDLLSERSSGVGPVQTISHLLYKTGTLICPGTPEASIATCDAYMISSSGLLPVHTFGGSHIAYTNVIESDELDLRNGFIEHFFTTQSQSVVNTTPVVGMQTLGTPTNVHTDLNGTEYLTRYYKKTTVPASFVLIKQVENDYGVGEGVGNSLSNYIVRMRWEENHHYNPPLPDEFAGFDMVKYDFVGQWIRLNSTKTTDYDENGQNPQVSTTTYTYGNLNNLQPTKVQATLSDNSILTTENKYAHDFAQMNPINQYQKLLNTDQINQVIETKTLKGTKELGTVKNEMKEWSAISSSTQIGPDFVSTQKSAAGTSETRIRYHKIDADGRVLEVSKEGGMRISYIYDYGNNFPIAEIKNASVTGEVIAYTSFESDGKGYWEFSGTSVADATAPTGRRSYPLNTGNITRNLTSNKAYLLTYWIKNGSGSVTINGTVSSKQLTVKNGWTAYEAKVTGTSLLTISGSANIDELRLHPVGALMTTYTYKPYVGISSSASTNSLLSRYEYDGHNRLKILRDGDGNILKQYEYTYGQPYNNPCTNTTPNWTVTGVQRCKIETVYYNYTGEKEREEKDMNNCSPTYLQTRWIVFATPSECTPIPNCTGEDKRVVNGECLSGVKVVDLFEIINGIFHCRYHYEWANGTIRGPNIDATGASACAL